MVAVSGLNTSRQNSGVDREDESFVEEEEDEEYGSQRQKSAPTTPEMKHKNSLAGPVQKMRHHSVITPPPRKISYKDETMKFREYNLFSKKVPKDAEAANIQVMLLSGIFEGQLMTMPFGQRMNLIWIQNVTGCHLQLSLRTLFDVPKAAKSDCPGGFL